MKIVKIYKLIKNLRILFSKAFGRLRTIGISLFEYMYLCVQVVDR